MTDRFATYSRYEPTGIEWLEAMPFGWLMFEGKRLFANRREESRSEDEQLAASQQYGVIPQALMMRLNDAKVMLAHKGTSTFRHVEAGDFVISLRSFEGGVEYSAYGGCVSPAYTVLAGGERVGQGYYRYLLKSDPFVAALQSTTDSLRDGKAISFSQFGAICLPIPSIDEQTKIAKFLDYETAKIDALIEKQQQLIALLKEKRQAVISHAVTKGLNPDAPMRDSGVEWLGRVPAHWNVCRVKQATSFITSGPRGWSDLISEDGLNVFLQSGDLNDKLGLRLETAKRITPPHNAEGVRTKMRDGDVVVCITGANTGRVAVANGLSEIVFVNQHLSLVRSVQDRIDPTFLATFLASSPVKSYFAVKQYGLKEGLSLANVAEAPLCLPPVVEQQAIVTHLAAIGYKMDRLEALAEEQVAVLQERRTALISAAVTGKIDVRGWKPPESKPETEAA